MTKQIVERLEALMTELRTYDPEGDLPSPMTDMATEACKALVDLVELRRVMGASENATLLDLVKGYEGCLSYMKGSTARIASLSHQLARLKRDYLIHTHGWGQVKDGTQLEGLDAAMRLGLIEDDGSDYTTDLDTETEKEGDE